MLCSSHITSFGEDHLLFLLIQLTGVLCHLFKFFSFFNCSSRFLLKLRSAKLYSKLNMVLNTCFVLRSSSILHLESEVQFFLSHLLRWCCVILNNFPSCFMIHKFSRVTYLNPSFSLCSRDLFNRQPRCWSYLVSYFT